MLDDGDAVFFVCYFFSEDAVQLIECLWANGRYYCWSVLADRQQLKSEVYTDTVDVQKKGVF